MSCKKSMRRKKTVRKRTRNKTLRTLWTRINSLKNTWQGYKQIVRITNLKGRLKCKKMKTPLEKLEGCQKVTKEKVRTKS